MSTDLTRRLTALRQGAGAQDLGPSRQRPVNAERPGAPSSDPTLDRDPSASLRQRLARLPGARHTHRGAAPRGSQGDSSEALSAWLAGHGGRWLEPGLALITQSFAYGSRHGNQTIDAPTREALEHFYPGASEVGPICGIDTETNGLSGGSGTLAFLIGVTHFEATALRIDQYLITRFASEAAMLRAVCRALGPESLLLSYNGKTYDLPLLTARLRLRRLDATLHTLPHLDLVHAVRRTFKQRWPSCRLSTVERELFQLHRQDDIPGHEIPKVWSDWLTGHDSRGLIDVVRHNQLDLLTLALLPQVLWDAQTTPRQSGACPAACAREHLRAGRIDRALAHLESRHGELDPPAQHLYARLARRTGNEAAALSTWEALARTGDRLALEQLAKFHEHRSHDFQRAYEFTTRLQALHPSAQTLHRHARVARKLLGRAQGTVDTKHRCTAS